MIDFIFNNLEYVAIPVIVGGMGLIVGGLITRHSAPVDLAQSTEALASIRQEVNNIVLGNHALLDTIQTKKSIKSAEIAIVKEHNLASASSIQDKIDSIDYSLITDSMITYGISDSDTANVKTSIMIILIYRS
jgi:hypothetical protein